MAAVLVLAGVVAFMSPASGALPSQGAVDPQPEAVPYVGSVDQTPIVSVADRQDINGATVPLMAAGTVAMLAIGFGMLVVRVRRYPLTEL